jgi:vibriolysin
MGGFVKANPSPLRLNYLGYSWIEASYDHLRCRERQHQPVYDDASLRRVALAPGRLGLDLFTRHVGRRHGTGECTRFHQGDSTMNLKPTLFFSIIAGLFASTGARAAQEQPINLAHLPTTDATTLSTPLGLSSQSEIQAVTSLPAKDGGKLVRMRQTYRGVPVYGQVVTLAEDSKGRAQSASGRVLQGIDADLPSVTPRLNAQQAMARWKAGHSDTQQASQERSQLYVYPDATGRARLVYKLDYLVGDDHPHRPTALVDANDGTVIREWDGLTRQTVAATGPGGNEKTGFYQYGVDRPYMSVTQTDKGCQMFNAAVATFDMHQTADDPVLWTFTCPLSQGDAINGAQSPINDAHYFGTVVYNMYVDWFATAPLDSQMYFLVHFLDRYEGAYWDGSYMRFGDGANNMYPLTVLDVTAHEVSHGFTEQRSGLEYVNQSGGMNEAFSDMAGEAAKFYDSGENDFLVGRDVMKPGSIYGDAFRYMCTPSRDGHSIDHASAYYDGMDTHYSSGVYNKAFCTLAVLEGWGTRKAFTVFTYANAVYWQPQETFNSGACGVENAAAALGYRKEDVATAFAVVGVSCPSGS